MIREDLPIYGHEPCWLRPCENKEPYDYNETRAPGALLLPTTVYQWFPLLLTTALLVVTLRLRTSRFAS